MPLKLLQFDRSPFLQHLDGGVLPLLRHLSPVPHFDEYGTESLQDTGLVVVVVDLEQFGGEEVGADQFSRLCVAALTSSGSGTFAKPVYYTHLTLPTICSV